MLCTEPSSRCSHVCVPTSQSVQGLPRALGKILPEAAGQTGMIASPGLSRACSCCGQAPARPVLKGRQPCGTSAQWALACTQILLSHNCLDQGCSSPYSRPSTVHPLISSASLSGLKSEPTIPSQAAGQRLRRRACQTMLAREGIGGCRSTGVQACVWHTGGGGVGCGHWGLGPSWKAEGCEWSSSEQAAAATPHGGATALLCWELLWEL